MNIADELREAEISAKTARRNLLQMVRDEHEQDPIQFISYL